MKNNGILLIKGLAIVGVVFQHLHNRRFLPQTLEWTDWVASLFCWCVLAFLAASGWLHAHSEQKKSRGMGEFVLSRIKRLLVPFAILVFVYAVGFELIQRSGIIQMRGTVPVAFLDKLTASLWPVDQQQTVAEQLYFLPLLFCISLPIHALVRWGGERAVMGLALAAYVTGLCWYPNSPNTGFFVGVYVWGVFSYGAGYWLQRHPAVIRNLLCAGLAAAGVAMVAGPAGVYKLLPLAFLAVLPWIEKTPESILTQAGEASGTIYIYHTPFLLQPLLILLAARVTPWTGQLAAAFGVSFLAITLCMVLHFSLRQTRWRGLLM